MALFYLLCLVTNEVMFGGLGPTPTITIVSWGARADKACETRVNDKIWLDFFVIKFLHNLTNRYFCEATFQGKYVCTIFRSSNSTTSYSNIESLTRITIASMNPCKLNITYLLLQGLLFFDSSHEDDYY